MCRRLHLGSGALLSNGLDVDLTLSRLNGPPRMALSTGARSFGYPGNILQPAFPPSPHGRCIWILTSSLSPEAVLRPLLRNSEPPMTGSSLEPRVLFPGWAPAATHHCASAWEESSSSVERKFSARCSPASPSPRQQRAPPGTPPQPTSCREFTALRGSALRGAERPVGR